MNVKNPIVQNTCKLVQCLPLYPSFNWGMSFKLCETNFVCLYRWNKYIIISSYSCENGKVLLPLQGLQVISLAASGLQIDQVSLSQHTSHTKCVFSSICQLQLSKMRSPSHMFGAVRPWLSSVNRWGHWKDAKTLAEPAPGTWVLSLRYENFLGDSNSDGSKDGAEEDQSC